MPCAPGIKYCLLMILFSFSFICLYSPAIDIYGFGSFFVLQTIFTLFVFIDLSQDENKFSKVLSVFEKSPFKIPLSWILFLGASFEFLAAFFMILTTNTIYKQFKAVQMSSDHQWRLTFIKHTFVIVTLLMFLLVLVYWNFNVQFSGTMKMCILVIMVGIISLSTTDVIYANHFTQLIATTTDG